MKKVNGAVQLMQRSKTLDAFTPIQNEFIRKAKVSPESKLLIIYLLTHPSDWVMHANRTAQELEVGQKKLHRMISELIEKGYMKRTKVNHRGKIRYVTKYSYLAEFLDNDLSSNIDTETEQPKNEPEIHNSTASKESKLHNSTASKEHFLTQSRLPFVHNSTASKEHFLTQSRLPFVHNSTASKDKLLNNNNNLYNEYNYISIVELKLDGVELPVDKIKSVDEKTTQEAGSVSSLVRVVDPSGSKTNVKAPTANDLTSGAMKVAGSKKSLVEEIFEAWKEKLKHPKAKLDVKRRALIEKALRDYSDSDIIQAFDGCSKTPHNMGDNDRGEVYDGLHIILRDSEQIERFMRNSENPPKPRSRDKAQEKRDRKDDIQNQMVKSCQDLAERFKQQNQRKEKEVHGEICGQDPRGLMWPN
jgi:hypothetical protein